MSSEKNTKFSDFIRNATDEERARVYGEVMDEACEMQKRVMGMSSESEKALVYPDVCPIKLGSYYTLHVSAMTTEGLHEKCDIAEQLAWRDMEIDTLARQLAEARLATYEH